jgi:hypothetical protein
MMAQLTSVRSLPLIALKKRNNRANQRRIVGATVQAVHTLRVRRFSPGPLARPYYITSAAHFKRGSE